MEPLAALASGSELSDEILAAIDLVGPIGIVLLRAGAALLAVVPSSPILLAAGVAQGTFWGSIYVLIGAQLGAMTAFFIGRRLGRPYVERRGLMAPIARTRFGAWLLDSKSSQNRLMAAVFWCRILPGLNLDGLSYVAGVTPIATWRFFVATLAALVPYTVLLVGAGHQLAELGAVNVIVFLVILFGVGGFIALRRLTHRGKP